MSNLSSRAVATAFAATLMIGSAFAQTPTAAPKAAPTAAPKAAPAHSAVSVECSKQADAKGLHGKDRKKFRSECKKNAGKPS